MDIKVLLLLDIQFECDSVLIFISNIKIYIKEINKCALYSSNDWFFSVALDFYTSATFTVLIQLLQ